MMATGQVESGEVRTRSQRAPLKWLLRLHFTRDSLTCVHSRRSVQFKGEDNLFCRYTFTYGPDWKIVQVRKPDVLHAFARHVGRH